MYAGDRSVVSVLYREPKLLKGVPAGARGPPRPVSVLYREPKLLKASTILGISRATSAVSVLYREPKLLKGSRRRIAAQPQPRFSALP